MSPDTLKVVSTRCQTYSLADVLDYVEPSVVESKVSEALSIDAVVVWNNDDVRMYLPEVDPNGLPIVIKMVTNISLRLCMEDGIDGGYFPPAAVLEVPDSTDALASLCSDVQSMADSLCKKYPLINAIIPASVSLHDKESCLSNIEGVPTLIVSDYREMAYYPDHRATTGPLGSGRVITVQVNESTEDELEYSSRHAFGTLGCIAKRDETIVGLTAAHCLMTRYEKKLFKLGAFKNKILYVICFSESYRLSNLFHPIDMKLSVHVWSTRPQYSLGRMLVVSNFPTRLNLQRWLARYQKNRFKTLIHSQNGFQAT